MDYPVISHLPDGVELREYGDASVYTKNGVYHRTDGPAFVSTSARVEQWYLNGKLHRIGGPAKTDGRTGKIEYWVNGLKMDKEEYEKHFEIKESEQVHLKVTKLPDGGKRFEHDRAIWYVDSNNKLHRDDGPAMVGKKNRLEQWYQHGKFHRIGGPAHITSGVKAWYVNGVEHRTDGPARVRSDGTVEYVVNGKEMSKEEFGKHFEIKESYGSPEVKITKLPDGGSRHENDSVIWYNDSNDEFHRSGGPALARKDGTFEQWYQHGKLHRIGGPAHKETDIEIYYVNGLVHRIGGPAMVNKLVGEEEYRLYGNLHRIDGPAVINGSHEEYWVNGRPMTRKEFEKHFGEER